MSNSIPGAYNSDREKLITKLLDAKKEPVRKLESIVKKDNSKLESIKTVSKYLTDFSSTLKSLFSFDNPFSERITKSSNENILQAVAKRDSEINNYSFKVLQIAKRDSFLSKNIDSDYEIPAGKYDFKVGSEDISFEFKGGNINDFSSKLNNSNIDVLSSKIVNITRKEKVFIVSAKNLGLENEIEFKGDSIPLGLELELIKKSEEGKEEVDFSKSAAEGIDSSTGFSLDEKGLLINQNTNVNLKFNKEFKIPKNAKISIQMEVKPAQKSTSEETEIENLIANTDSVEIRNVKISNIPSKYGTVPSGSASKLAPSSSPISISLDTDIGDNQLPNTEYNTDKKEYNLEFDVSEMGKIAKGLKIKNSIENSSLFIKKVTISSKDNGYVPVNAASQAQDAVLDYEGIKFKRNKNDIDDIISGLTLSLKKENPNEPVDVSVEPDKDRIVNSIITFVSDYNKIVREANILTASKGRKDDIISNSFFSSKEEEQDAEKRAGIMQGDMLLVNMKNSIRSIVSETYPTSLGTSLSMLEDVGISVNPSGQSGLTPQVLYGYLNVDTDKLDKAIADNIEALKDIFGNDTNNDLIIDNGVAFKMLDYLSEYSSAKGLLSNRKDTINKNIKQSEDKIETYKKDIEDYEKKLRMNLDKMDQASKQLDQSSKQMENWFPK